MPTIEQQKKLSLLLERLGTKPSLIHFYDELKKIQDSIPNVNLDLIYSNIKEIRERYISISSLVVSLKETIDNSDKKSSNEIRKILKKVESLEEKTAKDIKELLKNLSDELDLVRSISISKGGGNMSRNIQVDGTNAVTPYTDINFKSGTNVSISKSTNNTTKYTDITFSVSGGSYTILPATGTINGVNTQFTFMQQPTVIVSDHAEYRVNKGWTWNAGTLTATLTIPPNDDIWGVA